MVAIKPIPAGSECYNDYGPCPRSDLLRRYGYTSDEYKPHDVVELNLDQIERVMVAKSGLSPKDFEARHMENCVSLQKKMTKILQRTPDCEDSEFLDDTYDIPATITGDSFFDPGLLLTIQALATDPKDNDQLQSMNKAPTRPTSTLVSELLFAILEDRLQEYKTTIAEDQAVLNDDSLPLRRRQAIEVRLGEKEILARAAATVKVAHNDHMESSAPEDRSAKRVKR
jgi:SET domain-containing protein 6